MRKNLYDNDLVGDWKLIEFLADPGDGGGEFVVVESEKIITFHTDGTVTSNGSLCNIFIESSSPTSGTYSSTNSTFKSSDCKDPNYNYKFEQNDMILVIDYPCIEPCRVKYRKE